MRTLLLNPPFLAKFSRPQRSPAVTKSGTLYFPMWLAYATGVLGENGFDVDLIDAPADNYSIDDVIERIKKFQLSLIVLDTSTPSIYNDVTVAGQLKDICPLYTFRVYPQILMGSGFLLRRTESLKLSTIV